MFLTKATIRWDEIPSDSYLRKINALTDLDELTFKSPITFLVGENGSGKSTLLEGIADAYGFNREGGTLNFNFSTYEDNTELGEHIRLARTIKAPFGYFFRAESFFNVATKAQEYKNLYNQKYLHEQSHGESFMAFFNAYDGPGLYLMDEPEAALLPQRQLSLLLHIKQMADAGSQFIIVSHSPILLGTPNADIVSFDQGAKHISYEESESYKVTEMFINNKDILLHQLLEEE